MIQKLIKIKIIFLLIPVIGLLLFFQNCGNIDVKTVEPDLTSKASGIKGQFCLSNTNTAVNINGELPPINNSFNTLLKFYVLPITSVIEDGVIKADSDVDGLSDQKENSLSAFGYNPSNRRSRGIIDAICYKRYGNANTSCVPAACTSTKKYFYDSIDQCDVDSFNGNAVLKGLNMDAVNANSTDYMPDIIEALRSTSIAAIDVDGSTNSDLDATENEREIIQNSDPNDSSSNTNNEVVFTLSRDAVSSCAGHASYSFSIPTYVTLPVSAFNDGSPLSHAENENLGLLVVVSLSLQGKVQYQSYLMKVPHGAAANNFFLEIKPQDFKFEGSY